MNFLLFFILEALIFAILPLSARVSKLDGLLWLTAATSLVCLAAAAVARRRPAWKDYAPALYALFAGGAAVLLSTLYAGDLVRALGFTIDNPPGVAAAKFSEAAIRTATVVGLMALAGAKWDSLYLGRGRLGLSLGVGAAGFVVMAAIAFVPLAGQPGMPERLLDLLPWILLFVLSNGLAEELLFRGLLIGRFAALLGSRPALLLTSIVFTLLHMQVNYVADVLQFLVVVFPLALLWGWLMQKTDTLWGSALFHAGADCVIILGIFATYS
jgi:hypothetical protein